MAEFLIQALDETAPMRYWRGDIIQTYPDGTCLEPPAPGKVILLVPGLDHETALPQQAEWWCRLGYSIVSSDLVTDTHRLRIEATEFNPNSGIGKLAHDAVRQYLDNWNAANITHGDNWVEFDLAILDVLRSPNFWRGLPLAGMTLTETGYTQSTGTHRCRVNYSASTVTGTECERAVRNNGCTIVSHNTNTKTLTFEATRQTVREQFEEDVRARVERMVVRRKYRFTEAAVAAMEAAGGMFTASIAQYNTYWRNKLTE